MKNKNQKKFIFIGISIIVLLAITVLGCFIIASQKNKEVDQYATTIKVKYEDINLEFDPQTTDITNIYNNIVTLSTIYNSSEIDETKLTYFDGSKAKYDEITNEITERLDAYCGFLINKFDGTFNSANIDINTANDDQIMSSNNTLNDLNAQVNQAHDQTLFNIGDSKSTWSMIWGYTESESISAFSEFIAKIQNKIEEIKPKIDQINAKAQAKTNTTNRKNTNATTRSGGSSDSKEAQAMSVARQIAAGIHGASQLEQAKQAANAVSEYCNRGRYTMEGPYYDSAYGVFIAGEFSCAGVTRALGMIFDCLGIGWTHVHPNEFRHQWPIINIDGQQGWADCIEMFDQTTGQSLYYIGYAAYGNHPYAGK